MPAAARGLLPCMQQHHHGAAPLSRSPAARKKDPIKYNASHSNTLQYKYVIIPRAARGGHRRLMSNFARPLAGQQPALTLAG